MNSTTYNSPRNTVILLGTTLLVTLLLSACASKVPFQYSAEAPAARGTTKVKKDENNNYKISIDVLNLAEASRLVAPKTTYVVWMESGGSSAAKNLGKLESESGMMSNTLKARFETTSTEKPTKIFITSEEDGSAFYPSSSIILTTNNF